MGTDSEKRRGKFGWGFAVSILLHVVLAALIFLKLPYQMPTPEENAVQVDLVPPPEEKQPEPPKPQEPPPPPKPEEAKKPDPPKPPPKPPEPEKKAQPIPVLKPAVEFGEKDSGPKQSADGAAAEEQATAAEEKPDDQPAEEAAAAPATPEPPVPAPKPAEPPTMLASSNPSDTKVQLNDQPKDTPPATDKPTPDAKPQAKDGSATGKPGSARKLTQAKKIFSRKETADPLARLAMGMVPRDVRFDRLCGTELVAQLQNGSPAFNPILFPRVVRPKGNVFDLQDGSFRDAQGWHELSFKCEVDSEAMKVVSFAYSVGKPIPKSEWKSRGFPEY